jgi:ABC-type nickel/cobalt efflux system permease component RcnA
MRSFRSANSFWYRTALYLAFVAIYLLFAGPLFSQLQSQWQALDHSSEHTHGHDAASHGTSAGPSSHHDDPLHHWYHPCDYCGIWQKTPTAPHHLPAIGSVAFITRTPLPEAFAQRAAAVQAYPHAYPRAPPLLKVI